MVNKKGDKFVLAGRWLRPIVWLNSTIEQRLRYQIPLRILRREKGNILEVGCGSHGITRFYPRLVIGTDICFGRISMGWLKPVYASACKLPFPDNSFSSVLSVDMLEHLSFQERKVAIEELVRVASRVLIIAVPCDEALSADRRLAKTLKSSDVPQWLQEHLNQGIPTSQEIENMLCDALSQKGFRYGLKVQGNVNIHLWYWLALTAHWLPIRLLVHPLLLLLSPLFNHIAHRQPCYRQVFTVTFKQVCL